MRPQLTLSVVETWATLRIGEQLSKVMVNYGRTLAASATWVLILSIIGTVIYLVHGTVYLPTSNTVGSNQPQPMNTTIEARPTDVEALVSLHLFGKPAGNTGTRPKNVSTAQATRLPLELKAVFAASENSASAAIIGQRGQKARLYAVGESVPGNAVLAEVYSDQVLLRRAGKLESLSFPKAAFTPTSTEPNSNHSGKSRTKAKPTQATVARAREAARQLVQDRDKAAAQLGLTPSSQGGYRITDVGGSPYFRSAGLQSGDVILSINGKAMSETQPTRAMLDELMASGTARVVLLRNNDRLTITAAIPNLR
ncbi:MAG: type II secretion system protein N [Pseudomonadota bacterium]|nr:type II secretion system protein N [Pseudomonadota bacterium]